MNYVEPIRDKEIIAALKKDFKAENMRNYIMFSIGLYTGLRISDILKLRVIDVKHKAQINLRENKTGKQKLIEINPALKKDLEEYVKYLDNDTVLIKSRKGVNKPIKRWQAYNILRKACKKYKLTSIGTHTLRKTFGYHFYQQTKDVATLQYIFNHSDPSVTLRYIGITQDGVNVAMKKFKY